MKYKIKNHIIDAKSPVEALKIHKLLDSVKDAEPTYRSVWLKVKEYVKSHYNFKYSRDFSGLMNWLNTQYGGILDEDEVYKILRDLNSKGYVMFITDSQEEIDYLTEEEEKAVDDYRQAIANTNNPKLLKLYQHILGEELEHIEELSSAEVVEDSCKTKDYQPPYAIWVKKNGKWKIWGGTHSTSVDKSAFIKEGYEDVKVVKNGEDVKDSYKDSYSYDDFDKDLEKMGISGHTYTLYKESKRGLSNLKRVAEISGGWWKNINLEKVYKLAIQVKDSCKTKDFNVNTVKKRISSENEFDNGHVLFNYYNMTSAEAEEKAKQMSLKYPNDVFYVAYDDIMNPSSNIRWKNGKKI